MIRWGLDPERPILAVIDGGKAIRSALKATFGGWVLIARCREHKWRNVLDHVPVAERAFIGRKLDKAWKQTDAVKGGAGAAGTRQQLQAAHPGAAAGLREGLEETLTVTRLWLSPRREPVDRRRGGSPYPLRFSAMGGRITGRPVSGRFLVAAPALIRPQLRQLAGIVPVTLFSASTAACSVLGYWWMFKGFQPYDDEGYLLISLQGFARGGALYDHVFSQYGPFFYEVFAALFGLLKLPFTLDNGRFVTLAIWAGSTLVLGSALYRFTHNLALGLGVQLVSFIAIASVVNEPMHPGSLLCLLLVTITAAATVGLERWPRVAFTIMGAALAAAVFVKVNVGAFAVLSIAFTFVLTCSALVRRRALRTTASFCFVAVPFLLMRGELHLPWVQVYAAHVGIAATALVVATAGARADSRRGLADLTCLAVGAAATVLAVVGVALGHGTTIDGLFRGTLIDPLRQPNVLLFQLMLPAETLMVDLIILAWAIVWSVRRLQGSIPHASVQATARIAAGLVMWVSILGALHVPGVLDVTTLGIGSGLGSPLALAWVAAVPLTTRDGYRSLDFVRVLLPALAVLQALHAFPVAGSQLGWATLLLVPVGAVAIGDGMSQLGWTPTRVAAASSVLLLALVTSWLPNAMVVRQEFVEGVRLSLPGARRVHVTPSQAATYRQVSTTLARRCSTFLTLPGMNSFYVMAKEDPPTTFNATSWMFLLSASEQQQVVDRARTIPRLCAVRNDELVAFWKQDHRLPDRPLLRYLENDFVPIENDGGYVVMVPRQ